MGMFGGTSQVLIHVIILVTALVLRIYKTEHIRSGLLLSLSVFLLVLAICLPSLAILFVSSVGPNMSVTTRIFSISGGVLTGASIMCLWRSISVKR